jgi:hypothetical protein
MYKLNIVLSGVVIALFLGASCFADSLVITYRSGNTQVVPLEESAEAVKGLQYLKDIPLQQEGEKAAPQKPVSEKPAKPQEEKKTSPNDKSNVRFKWGSPKIGE